MTEFAQLAVAVALVFACGVFVAAEFAFLAVNRAAVEEDTRRGDRNAAGVLAALRSLSTQLSGAQVGITLTNLAIGFLVEPAVARLLDPYLADLGLSRTGARTTSAAVALTLATVATMVFGELVPKNLAIAHPQAVARVVQRPMRTFTALTRPLSHGFNILANRLVRLLGVEPAEELASARNPEELVSLVQRSAEQGTLGDTTADLLRNVLTFDDLRAAEVMTPRTRVATVARSATVVELLEAAQRTGRTRFPVLGDAVDDVRGVVSIVDAFRIPADRRAQVRVAEVATPAYLVPSVLPVDDLLAGLFGQRAQLAVVIDEFGGLDGVVSREDLVEELVGDLFDEHDRSDHDPAGAGGGAHDEPWSLSGLLRPDEAREMTGLPVPDGGQVYETLAGLLLAGLGRLPVAGDSLVVDGVELQVTAMDGRRVDRVAVRAVPPTDADGEGEGEGDGAAGEGAVDGIAGEVAAGLEHAPAPRRDLGGGR